jgi:hypothetical protein
LVDWASIEFWEEDVAPVEVGIVEEYVNEWDDDEDEEPFITELILLLLLLTLLEAAFVTLVAVLEEVEGATFTIWFVNENTGDCIKFCWVCDDDESIFLISSSMLSIL